MEDDSSPQPEDVQGDLKVGTIVLGSSKEASRDTQCKNVKTERRYVYASEACQDRPYYLSKTLNRMFVVDKDRIEYFPGGEEPEALKVAMQNQERGESEEEEEVAQDAVEVKPVCVDARIGTIAIKVKEGTEIMYDVPTQRGVVHTTVYLAEKGGGKPYYFTSTGNKIFVVDHSRIVLDNPPPPKKRKRPVYI